LKKDVLSSTSNKASFFETFCEQRTDYN